MAADKQPPTLHLVPPAAPTPAEEMRERIKKMPRPDGMLQCKRCGGRLVLNTAAGVVIENGRRKFRGTVIDKDVCGDCWKLGIIVPMVPELKSI